jgi:glucose-6-phosphate 1-dehydrogenase
MVAMSADNNADAVIFVLFGAAGDLTWRLIGPAVFNLHLDRRLPERFVLIGVDHRDYDDDALRERLRQGAEQFSRRKPSQEHPWEPFAARVQYLQADFTDLQAYQRLKERIEALEQAWEGPAHHVFYLATPPTFFAGIARGLGSAGLAEDRARSRAVVEKPLGYDFDSFRQINGALTQYFTERQVFRIDHFLGKETVQNMLAFRFANPMFEPVWNRRYVDHVAITVAEDIGVEHRGAYYEGAGALRDMVQNHLLQILCLVAMEPPISLDADEVRNKKVDVLHAVRPIPQGQVHDLTVRGQYGAGWIRGEQVPGYREEEGVEPESSTETFAALKLFVDNWRWQDVPFYLRTGKRLMAKASEISIRFRDVPHQTFPAAARREWHPARLVMCIQPDEGIVLKFHAKQPGLHMRLRPVDMRFSYQEAFKVASRDAYETLIWDIIRGDATLFMRADQVEAAWSLLMPVLEVWGDSPPSDFPNYVAGTWGPELAEALIAQDGRTWMPPTLLSGPSLPAQGKASG